MTPNKFGAILALLLTVITVPMFFIYEELTLFIPINILLVGVPLLILYFIFVYIYRNFSKKVFVFFLTIFLLTPAIYFGTEIYIDKVNEKKRLEEWSDFSNDKNVTELKLGKEIKVYYGPGEENQKKFRVTPIEKNSDLLINIDYKTSFNVGVVVSIFDSSKKQITRGWRVENAKEGETYYINIDQTELNSEGKGFYYINVRNIAGQKWD